jgi:hypothetical protein
MNMKLPPPNAIRQLIFGSICLGILLLGGCDRFRDSDFEPLDQETREAVGLKTIQKFKNTSERIPAIMGKSSNVQKIDSFLYYADMLKNHDVDIALIYAEQARELAERTGKKRAQAMSAYYLAMLTAKKEIYGEKESSLALANVKNSTEPFS